ncbi:MAG: HEAT repeat domain-containing protein [Acidobacteria bacterium]|nr:HEAT repeat domain-containing protein [Acidobacteriota bacterium]
MTLKVILRYIVLPLLAISLIVFLVFRKPIIQSLTFDHHFDRMVQHYGRVAIVDFGEKIVAMGQDAEEPLIEKVESPRTTDVEKRLAMLLLGMIQSEKAESILLRNLEASDADLRLGAVQGLKYMMKPEYVSRIGALTGDPVELIRENVAAALGQVYSPESIQILQHIVRNERVRTIWYRAWQSLRHIRPVNGVVTEKFRINKDLQIMPADEENSEVLFTYYFVKVHQGGEDMIFNLTWSDWQKLKIGDRLIKESLTSDFTILSPEEETA